MWNMVACVYVCGRNVETYTKFDRPIQPTAIGPMASHTHVEVRTWNQINRTKSDCWHNFFPVWLCIYMFWSASADMNIWCPIDAINEANIFIKLIIHIGARLTSICSVGLVKTITMISVGLGFSIKCQITCNFINIWFQFSLNDPIVYTLHQSNQIKKAVKTEERRKKTNLLKNLN